MGGHDAVLDSGEGTRSFGDPVTVSRMGIEQARAKQYDVVIVDTAGRLAVDADLMQQASDIRAAISPDEVLFVIDAMIGQAAVETAQAFHEGVAFTGVVLSKARRRRPWWRRPVGRRDHRRADHVRLDRREGQRRRGLSPRPHGEPHPRHG